MALLFLQVRAPRKLEWRRSLLLGLAAGELSMECVVRPAATPPARPPPPSPCLKVYVPVPPPSLYVLSVPYARLYRQDLLAYDGAVYCLPL